MKPQKTARFMRSNQTMSTQAIYDVVEIFTSINGEGPLVGQLAVFIRMKGCNLSCSYCDTKWANETDAPAKEMTANQIYQTILESGIKNVTLTGGEPLYRPFIKELLKLLASDSSLHIEIETNGSINLEPFCDLGTSVSFTMDYKLSCSNMEQKMCLNNFSILEPKDTVKFVVGSLADCQKAFEIIQSYQLEGRCHIYLSPVFGMIEPPQIVEFMKQNKMNGINLQIQMHKVIWDPEERGV